MNEEETTQPVSEENVPIPEKDLEEAAGAGWIIIDRIETTDPPPTDGGG